MVTFVKVIDASIQVPNIFDLTAIISHKNCLLNHHFSPHLVHAHSKQ